MKPEQTNPAVSMTETGTKRRPEGSVRLWDVHHYYEIFKRQFDTSECQQIIDLHRRSTAIQSIMPGPAGLTLRESDLFWVPRLSDNIGQAQLTRYRSGQHYDWHMDLGPGQLSLRKITVVVELVPRDLVEGGGLEIFYGDLLENKVDLDAGDIVVFPSFVMHRAAMVMSGTRWSLVLWLNGTRPLE
jgi:predicted 2-oxoglutarate/Fe(II)-dependent dioxygenase YbiX